MNANYPTKSTGGVADCFFYCAAPKEEVYDELMKIYKNMELPEQVEFILTDNLKNPEWDGYDPELPALIEEGKTNGLNYRMRVVYPKKTNEYVSMVAVGIARNLYHSDFYEKEDPFQFEIIYEKNGMYSIK